MQKGWQHFHHGADIGVRGIGTTLAEAFAQTALAMSAVITEPGLISTNECIKVECEVADNEYLLMDWLNALVYEMATRHMLFSTFDVTIQEHHLSAKVCGEKIDQQKHQPAVEVKGATLTELKVVQQQDGSWLAQCVVDV